MNYLLPTFCLGALVGPLTGPEPFLAYIDPGIGSLILQMAIAGLLSGMFAVRQFWQRIRFASSRRSPAPTPPPSSSEVEGS